jgi:hypothetical protein
MLYRVRDTKKRSCLRRQKKRLARILMHLLTVQIEGTAEAALKKSTLYMTDPKWPWREIYTGRARERERGEHQGGCETSQPGCHGQLLVSMEANTPKTRLVTANLQRQREARALFSECSGIPVFPQVPEAQQHKSGSRLGRNARRCAVVIQPPYVRISRVAEPDRAPETLGEGTLKENVVRCLQRRIAHGAPGLLRREDVLAQQRGVRRNPRPGQHPGKESHLWWGVVFPHEAEERGVHATPSAQPIERRGVERPILAAAPHQLADIRRRGEDHARDKIQ